MYLSDMHTHSIASGHGTECTITNMARAAAEKGLRLLGITDHGPGTLAAGTSSYFRSLTYSPKKHFGVELLTIKIPGTVHSTRSRRARSKHWEAPHRCPTFCIQQNQYEDF